MGMGKERKEISTDTNIPLTKGKSMQFWIGANPGGWRAFPPASCESWEAEIDIKIFMLNVDADTGDNQIACIQCQMPGCKQKQ